jgi:hypothetical protein
VRLIFCLGLAYRTALFWDLRTVSLVMPVCAAIARQLSPSSLSLRTWAVSTATTGLPNFTPGSLLRAVQQSLARE